MRHLPQVVTRANTCITFFKPLKYQEMRKGLLSSALKDGIFPPVAMYLVLRQGEQVNFDIILVAFGLSTVVCSIQYAQ